MVTSTSSGRPSGSAGRRARAAAARTSVHSSSTTPGDRAGEVRLGIAGGRPGDLGDHARQRHHRRLRFRERQPDPGAVGARRRLHHAQQRPAAERLADQQRLAVGRGRAARSAPGARQPRPDVGARPRADAARPDGAAPRVGLAGRRRQQQRHGDEARAEDRGERLRGELDDRLRRLGRGRRASTSSARPPRPACSASATQRLERDRQLARASSAQVAGAGGGRTPKRRELGAGLGGRAAAVSASLAAVARVDAARRRRGRRPDRAAPRPGGRRRRRRAAGRRAASRAACPASSQTGASGDRSSPRSPIAARSRAASVLVADAVAVGVVEHVERAEPGVGERLGRAGGDLDRAGSPSAPCAQTSSRGSAAARGALGVPAGDAAPAAGRATTIATRCWIGTPVRGVRTTSGSGGAASPAPSTSSAAAARAGLPDDESGAPTRRAADRRPRRGSRSSSAIAAEHGLRLARPRRHPGVGRRCSAGRRARLTSFCATVAGGDLHQPQAVDDVGGREALLRPAGRAR